MRNDRKNAEVTSENLGTGSSTKDYLELELNSGNLLYFSFHIYIISMACLLDRNDKTLNQMAKEFDVFIYKLYISVLHEMWFLTLSDTQLQSGGSCTLTVTAFYLFWPTMD